MKMIGSTLDYYRIEAKIGQGGMGRVYRATDSRLLRAVAIKILSLASDVDEKSRLRFLREAQAASLLNHPNICTVYDIKLGDKINYIVMEYIEGQTLRKLLETNSSLSEEQVIEIGKQICDGLHAAHAKGILHRDIKPDNIMITAEGWVKITDFGLAKLKASEYDAATAAFAQAPNRNLLKTSFSTIQGTASYMSPEQIRKEDVDERTDLFSLGIVLYELLTGHLPFHGDDQISIMQAILNDEPEPFENHGVMVSPDMRRIVLGALEKDKTKRPRDALSLKNELARIPLKSVKAALLDTISTKLRKRNRPGLKLALSAFLVLFLVVFLLFPHLFTGIFSRLQPSIAPKEQTPQVICTIAVTPFWGVGDEALHEGRVMQRLIERRMLDDMAGEPYIKIITKETKTAIKSHEQARKFGQTVKASLVVWGEVISLRGEIEFQAYITAVDPVQKYRDNSLDDSPIDLSMANQITLRQTHADDVVSVTLTQAAQFIDRPLQSHEKALEIFDRISHPTHGTLCAEASMAVLAKKWPRAQALIESLIAKEPESLQAYYVLGFYHQARQEWDQAIKAFQRLLQFDPDNTGAFDGLASVYRALGDYPTAIEFSQKAVERNPMSDYYIGHLGSGYFGNKQYDLAIQHFKRAMELRVDKPQLPCELADVYLTVGDYKEALRYFNKALQVDPQYRWTHDMRGLIYIHLGKYRKAIRAYNKSITFEPNDHRHYHGLAAAHIAKRDYQQAVQALERAVALKKNDVYGRILLYLSHNAAEQPDKARAHLDTLRANSDQEEWPDILVNFYDGAFDEKTVLKAAEHDHPNTDRGNKCEAYYYMGMAYLLDIRKSDSGSNEERAADYFRKAIDTDVRTYFEYELARVELDRLAK